MSATSAPTGRSAEHAANRRGEVRSLGGGRQRAAGAALLGGLLMMAFVASSARAASVPLGSAGSFAVLAGSTVTNAGPSVIHGNVGVNPGSAVTGFGPGTVIAPSVIYRGGPIALQAKNDLTTAYNTVAGLSSTEAISADLAGRTLAPGVYTATSSLALNGDLTLDAKGDPNAVFVFQAGSTLLVGTTTISRVLLINGAHAANVFWQVGSSATIGVRSAFAGNILALTSITMNTNATLDGRALARNGAVTLDGTTIDMAAAPPPPPPPPPPPAGGGGGSCAVANPGGLASNNGVVLGKNFTGDPAHGGQLIAAEWLQLGLLPGAETVRRQTSDGIIITRTDVPCVDGASSSRLRPEVREMTLPSRDGSIKATFSRARGSYLGDPNVRQPSDLKDSTLAGSRVPHAANGPLAAMLQRWQTAPPGHGSTYQRYDARGRNSSEWVDAVTHLPLKLTSGSGSAQQSTYWTYAPNAIAPATLPADFFLLSRPADLGQDEQDDSYLGGQLPGSVSDSHTGASFMPMSLGHSPRIGGQSLCLANAGLYRFFERGQGSADAHITRVDADYVLRARGSGCVPGRGDASQADVQISTFARGSAVAAANHRSFRGSRAVRVKRGQRSPSVRVMLGGEDRLALVDIGQSTVLIRSSLPIANRPGAANVQILALLARLLGSPATAKDSSSTSRATPVAAAARAPVATTARYEDLTHAAWLFSGSLYNQSAGIPRIRNRLDPVSVIWKGGGQASITNVRNYTHTYWKEAAIPHGYPGGTEMKPRDWDFPPSSFCREGHGVFFRRSGTNRDDGKWEQSDPHGYMSTNGLCANQYHIRMWSSIALHDLTGAHLLEFVLAPIHHDHVKGLVCSGSITAPVCYYDPTHGPPDLSFDKARYAYQAVMGASLCVINHWKINPESEKFNYQKLGAYSGYVSRITFWLRARHPGCKGA